MQNIRRSELPEVLSALLLYEGLVACEKKHFAYNQLVQLLDYVSAVCSTAHTQGDKITTQSITSLDDD